MSDFKMTEENKKTITAFIAGLLVGGLLVFIFSNPTDSTVSDAPLEDEATDEVSNENSSDDNEDSTEVVESTTDSDSSVATPVSMNIGDAEVEVSNQAAGITVMLGDVTFPAEAGWIGVRDYEDNKLTGLLGVSRWNKEEGLLPSEVALLRATESGRTYAVVFYSDNGDKEFDLATDAQISEVVATFTAK